MLCAPSLGGESFGMVLTEAFAAGTPVIASDIAGYRDVVRDGVDGVLVAPGDAQGLAEALRDLYEEPERRMRMAQRRSTRRRALCLAAASPPRCSVRTRTRSRPRRRSVRLQRAAVRDLVRAPPI